MPKVPKKLLKGFTVQEVSAMIEAFSYKNYIEARNKAIVAMLSDCGLRAMEIRGLLTQNVKETKILVNGKGNKERIMFISPPLKKILIRYERLKKDYLKDRIVKTDHYFLSYTADPLSHMGIYNVIKEAGERVKIEEARCSPHTFRHFFAVQCILNGVDILTLSKLLGHGDLSTTQRYLQSLEDFELIKRAMPSSPLMNMKKALSFVDLRLLYLFYTPKRETRIFMKTFFEFLDDLGINKKAKE
ncbi:tyrosine-type recombinase/integrase [Bacillus paranthracis]